MRLERMSWVDAREYFEHSDTVLLTVGSLECHGKHLPLGTDTLIPTKLLELIEPETDVAIAPVIPFGACDYLADYPGTVSLGYDVLYAVLTKVTEGLYAHGARRFAVLNGHGGNIAALERVGLDLRRKGALLAELNWWLMAWELDPAWTGGHGGGEETAGVLAVDPALVRRERIEDMRLLGLGEAMPSTGFKGICYKGVSIPVPRLITEVTDNGWIGPDHPSSATEEWGRKMLASCASYIVDFLEEFKKAPLC